MIIGEAVKGLSVEFRTQHAEVPWRNMSRMRDLLMMLLANPHYGFRARQTACDHACHRPVRRAPLRFASSILLIHRYHNVDLPTVWLTIVRDIPILIVTLEPVAPRRNDGDSIDDGDDAL